MAKKILTVEDLLAFCEQNKLYSFDSHDTGKEIVVEIPATFESEEEEDNKHVEGLAPFKSKAFHDHVNLNGSNIEEETFEDELPSAHFRPILANVVKTEDGELDFGAHDFHVEEEDGEKKIVYDERPIGVINGDLTTIEYDEDAKVNRAILQGYLFAEYCSDEMAILERRGTVDCSVELSVRKMSYDAKNKVINLDSYYVSGLTLLGAEHQPGMAGSDFGLVEFNKKEFKLDEKFIEVLEKLNTTLSAFNKSEKGGTTVTKFEELLQKYGKTVEDVTFEYENLSDEELEAKFAEVFEEHETEPEPQANEIFAQAMSDKVKEFALSLNEKLRAIYELVGNTYTDDWYSVDVYEDEKRLDMHGYFNEKHYRQSYTENEGVFALEGDRVETFARYLTQEELDKFEGVKAENESVLAENEAIKAENEELKQYKADKEFEIAHAERMAVIADYSSISETEEYKSLLNDIDKYSKDEIVEKADAIVGKYARQGKQFSFEKKQETPAYKPAVRMSVSEDTKNTAPAYGGIFD